MLIEIEKKYAFKDLMATSPFFFIPTFNDCYFSVILGKQQAVDILFKNELETLSKWCAVKPNNNEIIILSFIEHRIFSKSELAMIWSALKKVFNNEFDSMLIVNKWESPLVKILELECEKEVIKRGNDEYLYIPIL